MVTEVEKLSRIRIRDRITNKKVNKFFRLVGPMTTLSFNEIGSLITSVDRQTDWPIEWQTNRPNSITSAFAEVKKLAAGNPYILSDLDEKI